MNILIEAFPTTIEIDGREYEINWDFKSCLRIILAFEDPELAGVEKQILMISNLYKEAPENVALALEKGKEFLDGNFPSGPSSSMRLYSFEKDAPFILAAFRQTHGIDLETTELHWWKFLALFMDLGSDTTFSSLVGLRKRLKTGKATKEERIAASEMGDLISLPEFDDRTLEEREAEEKFRRLINKRKKES